jgi:hypothetical protein
MSHKILRKVAKCFACEKYGHTYVKCVTNLSKAKKLKVNSIDKWKDKILLREDLAVKWLVETIKSFKFSTLYKAIWEFLEGHIQDWKGGKQRKAQVQKMTKTYKT